ncbi:cation transporter [Shewanella sp. TC10]|uniref:cation transporter n=1 Tax=Shewanella sp. TC10 TaxID=1419739 RepID=UPI00129E51D5|nr:cation transporter [Shewanella sp. TC10]
MCEQNKIEDKQLLIVSALAALTFAVMGVVVGLMSGSIVILFDGGYSLIGLLLTMLSLAASNYMRGSSRSQFAFGKAIIEPIVVAIKAAVILMLLGFSLSSALNVFLSGGREIDMSFAAVFGFVNLFGCLAVWWFLVKQNEPKRSGLFIAEIKLWKMDTVVSGAVCAGLITGLILTYTPWHAYAVYADSVMMLLIGAYFIKVPLIMLTGAFRELLMMKPSQEICSLVHESVTEANGSSPQELKLTGIAKVGPELMVNINVNPKKSHQLLPDLHKVRLILNKKLARLSLDVKLNLDIVTEAK